MIIWTAMSVPRKLQAAMLKMKHKTAESLLYSATRKLGLFGDAAITRYAIWNGLLTREDFT